MDKTYTFWGKKRHIVKLRSYQLVHIKKCPVLSSVDSVITMR